MLVWLFLFLGAIVLWFGSDLPDLKLITSLPRRPSVIMLDREGKVLSSYGDLYGESVDVNAVSPHAIQALLAIEDRRFYRHWGVDPIGVMRAFFRNMRSGHIVQGGSTITQQLAKNFLQSQKMYTFRDRSFGRKIKEILLAFQIERKFTKNQILAMHLNRVYLGAGTWGIDAAALKYFGRHARDLGLYESAVIMGLLQAPSRYSPIRHYERAEIRAKQVLKAMVESGFIKEEAALAAMALPVPLQRHLKQDSPRYFTDWVMDRVQKVIDVHGQDVVIHTTLDSTLQRIAEHQSQRVMEHYGKRWGAQQIALVSMTPQGAVRAMIGGRDYGTSVFNRATQSQRQPGSTFKYFVYLAALEDGYTPDSVVSDARISLNGWCAKNFRYTCQGSISLRDAFARSVNSVSIRLTLDVGVKRVLAMARRLGIRSPIPPSLRNATIALGTLGSNALELTGAFAVMANNGNAVTPYGVERITNRRGEILYQHKTVEKPLLDPQVLAEMRSLLQAVTNYGSGRLANFTNPVTGQAVPILGKTGTSNKGSDDRDLWFVGIAQNLITGVWSGNDNEKAMVHQQGGSPSLHLWRLYNLGANAYEASAQDPRWKASLLATHPYLNTPLQPHLETKQEKEEEGEKSAQDEEEGEGAEGEDVAESPEDQGGEKGGEGNMDTGNPGDAPESAQKSQPSAIEIDVRPQNAQASAQDDLRRIVEEPQDEISGYEVQDETSDEL